MYDKETFERYTLDVYCQDVETLGLNEALLSQNVPITTVSKYLGHSDTPVTLQVYTHFVPDTQVKVINAFENLFS